MKFEFNHKPIQKARHRHTWKGGKTWSYDPKEKEKQSVRRQMSFQLEDAFNSCNRDTMLEASELAKAQSFTVCFEFDLPVLKSVPESTKNLMRWSVIPCITKPDIDNLQKFYLDCANGVLFKDDSLIIISSQTKKYSPDDNPRVIMTVTPNKKISLSENVLNILKIFGPEKLKNLKKYCYLFQNLPYPVSSSLMENELNEIATTLLLFADEFAVDLNKIRTKKK